MSWGLCEVREYNEFIDDLKKSQEAVAAVAMYLQRRNQYVIMPPHRETPSPEERYQYVDNCDLMVGRPVQIKGSSRDFHSVEEFGFSMITVDEAYKIEQQADCPPVCYFIVNKSKTGAIFIGWNTRKHWDKYTAKEERQGGRDCVYYRCPASLCQ